jgi:hypothetical protein
MVVLGVWAGVTSAWTGIACLSSPQRAGTFTASAAGYCASPPRNQEISSDFKRIMSPAEYCFKGLLHTIKSVFSVHALLVFLIFSLSSSRGKLIWRFCLLFWKNLQFKKLLRKPHQIPVFLCSPGRFFPVYIHSRLSEQFSGPQAGYRTTHVRDTGGYQKVGTSSLKRVTGRNFTISKLSHKSKKKLGFGFLYKTKKTSRNYENRQRSFRKYCFDF